MKSLADDTFKVAELSDEMSDSVESTEAGLEGNLRATGQSRIEKTPQALGIQELVDALCGATERVGFEPTGP